MNQKSEPWYIHAALGVVIVILLFVLIKVAIIDPGDYLAKENYYKTESRLRMKNIREAQMLWAKQHNGSFCSDMNKLVDFIKNDSLVQAVKVGTDTVTGKPSNPFVILSNGSFDPDSLFFSPKSRKNYLLAVDTVVAVDSTFSLRGALLRIDSTITIGAHYYLECPDGYGKVGDLHADALKNSMSWE